MQLPTARTSSCGLLGIRKSKMDIEEENPIIYHPKYLLTDKYLFYLACNGIKSDEAISQHVKEDLIASGFPNRAVETTVGQDSLFNKN